MISPNYPRYLQLIRFVIGSTAGLLVAGGRLMAGTDTSGASLVVVCDLSGSMKSALPGQAISKFEAVASQLAQLGSELDRETTGGPGVILLGFTTAIDLRVHVQAGAGASMKIADFTEQAQRVVEANRRTALYDVLCCVLQDTPGNNLVITTLSDGGDNASREGALQSFLQESSKRGVKLNILGLGVEATSLIKADLDRLPRELSQTVLISETKTLAGGLLPPRITLIERDGKVDLIATGAAASNSRLEWRIDGAIRPDSGEHISLALRSGEHVAELLATLPDGAVLRAARTFVVSPPKAPSTTIIALKAQPPYVSGKRVTFVVAPAGAVSAEWSGPGLVGAKDQQATFVLERGINNIHARVVWPTGAASQAHLAVAAEPPCEVLSLEATPPLVGKTCEVRSFLGSKPIAAIIRLNKTGSSSGLLNFVPENDQAVTASAEYDDEGLVHRATLTLLPKYPSFSAEIAGPTDIDHGKSMVLTAVVGGEDAPKSFDWKWLVPALGTRAEAHGPSASFPATNESGDPITASVELRIEGGSGRTLVVNKEIRINSRPLRPVAALQLPPGIVRVGDKLPIIDVSSGLIERRTLSVNGFDALPVSQVPFIEFKSTGVHRICLAVAGPGGDDARDYFVEVAPALTTPQILSLVLPDRIFSGEDTLLAAEVKGDFKAVSFRANGELIGSSSAKVTWRPVKSGSVLLEVLVEPARADHRAARKQVELKVLPKYLRLAYSHPREIVGGVLGLLILGGVLIAATQGPRLRGTLTVREGSHSETFLLKGKRMDLTAMLSKHGFNTSEKIQMTTVGGGELALIQDGMTKLIPAGHEVSVSTGTTITWNPSGQSLKSV